MGGGGYLCTFLKNKKIGGSHCGRWVKTVYFAAEQQTGLKLRPKPQYAGKFRNHGVCLQEENPLSRPHMPLMFRLYASHHRVKIAMSRGSCELSGPSFSKSHAQPA